MQPSYHCQANHAVQQFCSLVAGATGFFLKGTVFECLAVCSHCPSVDSVGKHLPNEDLANIQLYQILQYLFVPQQANICLLQILQIFACSLLRKHLLFSDFACICIISQTSTFFMFCICVFFISQTSIFFRFCIYLRVLLYISQMSTCSLFREQLPTSSLVIISTFYFLHREFVQI